MRVCVGDIYDAQWTITLCVLYIPNGSFSVLPLLAFRMLFNIDAWEFCYTDWAGWHVWQTILFIVTFVEFFCQWNGTKESETSHNIRTHLLHLNISHVIKMSLFWCHCSVRACVLFSSFHSFGFNSSIRAHEMLNEARTIYSILYLNDGIIYFFLVDFYINWPEFFSMRSRNIEHVGSCVKNLNEFIPIRMRRNVFYFFLCHTK